MNGLIALATAAAAAGATLGILGAGPVPSGPGPGVSPFGPPLPTQVTVGPPTAARPIAAGFWGVDVSALATPNSTDVPRLLDTPARYLHFPTGFVGEEFNYTSSEITNSNGTVTPATLNVSGFIGICRAIHCHAILQLPAEIDRPATAAYYVQYIVDRLGFQPAYWEIGDSPSGWQHFGIPWSAWTSAQDVNITPIPFAVLVQTYIAAILPVDPGARFLALGTGLGPLDFSRSWVEDLAEIDGGTLSGITLHSYPLNATTLPATTAGLFAGLSGGESMPEQVSHVREWIRAGCPSCQNLGVFVVEANAAQIAPWYPVMATFNGTLYLAADAINGLDLGLENLDWFCFQCDFPNVWETSPAQVLSPYYLFSDVLDHLENETLPTNVSGASPVFAAATFNGSGESVLVVNLNETRPLALDLSAAQFCAGTPLNELLWSGQTPRPVEGTGSVGTPVTLPPLSLGLFGQASCSGHSPATTPPVAPGGAERASVPNSLRGISGSRGCPSPAVASASPDPTGGSVREVRVLRAAGPFVGRSSYDLVRAFRAR